MRSSVVPALLCLASVLQAQTPPPSSAPFRDKQIPHEAGFRVFIVPDMEGMGSAVDSARSSPATRASGSRISPARTTGTASACCSPGK